MWLVDSVFRACIDSLLLLPSISQGFDIRIVQFVLLFVCSNVVEEFLFLLYRLEDQVCSLLVYFLLLGLEIPIG